jgi:hypothetical protein
MVPVDILDGGLGTVAAHVPRAKNSHCSVSSITMTSVGCGSWGARLFRCASLQFAKTVMIPGGTKFNTFHDRVSACSHYGAASGLRGGRLNTFTATWAN